MPSEHFDVAWIRSQFPMLNPESGKPPIFFDNPGGTQVPLGVVEAVSDYYLRRNSNVGGAFETSRRTDQVLAECRRAVADFLCAPEPETIVFGPNMTTLTFHLARSLAEAIRPGDEIVLTDLDHDANVTPWQDLATAGAVIKFVEFDPADCTLSVEAVKAALTERTRLVAVTHASNAVGSIPDVAAIVRVAHAMGALVFVDAVQFAPHGPIDVQALDCDFLACSAYKFFGPHVGILYGKRQHLETLKPHKVRPAKNSIPYRWETGTLNHEGIAGVLAALHYLKGIGAHHPGIPATAEIGSPWHPAMRAIQEYEVRLSQHLLTGLVAVPDLQLYGITDRDRLFERVPTFMCTTPKLSPRAIAEFLGERGICCWSGNYYALRLMERLGLEASGGALRIGLTHYNTTAEIDALIEALHDL